METPECEFCFTRILNHCIAPGCVFCMTLWRDVSPDEECADCESNARCRQAEDTPKGISSA